MVLKLGELSNVGLMGKRLPAGILSVFPQRIDMSQKSVGVIDMSRNRVEMDIVFRHIIPKAHKFRGKMVIRCCGQLNV